MGLYTNLAFRIFGNYSLKLIDIFPEIKSDLLKADLKYSTQEYLSIALFSAFLSFLIILPILSFTLAFLFQIFLFSFIFSITLSISISSLVFFFILNYPKLILSSKAKKIDSSLPFATLYLSTIAGSRIPLHKVMETFVKFSTYKEINNQIDAINQDVNVFGLDIHTALERGVERSPSRNLKELLYGILATIRAGADLPGFLKEKASNLMLEYRRKLFEFSHSLTVYIEVYLTSIVLGAIFFSILTGVISGIGGSPGNLIILQFLLTFIFIPLISIIFLVIIRNSTPGAE